MKFVLHWCWQKKTSEQHPFDILIKFHNFCQPNANNKWPNIEFAIMKAWKQWNTLELECIISGGLGMCLTIWTKNHWTIYDRMTYDRTTDRPTDRRTNQPNKQINLINAKFIFATHCVYLTMLLNRVRALKMWNFTLM